MTIAVVFITLIIISLMFTSLMIAGRTDDIAEQQFNNFEEKLKNKEKQDG